ncbi:hypothetical protein KFL_005050090 [Klebsormidium nitens]|uniref:Uncharacterized protein n=1 Tax=Klebsormidium nitens TaxID=105231 RepID=A0A1Y1IGT4_KLENI|nr:hypothetical protein KFL_005050090 [Klebsormidium nitens]|eukprot:GAQ89272.1 hypothetical protein KFL_005050090 [Klebsormidium nitens]
MAAAIQSTVASGLAAVAQLPTDTAVPRRHSSASCITSRIGRDSAFVPLNRLHAQTLCRPMTDEGRSSRGPVRALFGGGGNAEDKKKKGIKREEEPQEYFQTKAELQGKSTFADPLAIIGVLSIFLPFIILGAAFSAGLVKLPS